MMKTTSIHLKRVQKRRQAQRLMNIRVNDNKPLVLGFLEPKLGKDAKMLSATRILDFMFPLDQVPGSGTIDLTAEAKSWSIFSCLSMIKHPKSIIKNDQDRIFIWELEEKKSVDQNSQSQVQNCFNLDSLMERLHS